MTKQIPKTMVALFLVSALSACSWLPKGNEQDSAELAKAAASETTDSTLVDEPSKHRRSSPRAGASGKKTATSSQDVVLSGKKQEKKKQGAVGATRNTESKISMIIPVGQGKPTQAVEPRPQEQGKASAVATNAKLAPTPKTKRVSTVSNRKGKRKFAGSAKKDLWNRVRQRSVLADVEHPAIDAQIAYLKRNPAYLNLLSQRSRPYLHYIVEQIDRRGLPMDLALVPMVESAFEPTAVSSKDAAGLWQIIPATGQERGLLIAGGYDGRFDIHTSTEAALGYLRYLNKLFKGDWLLALAAYNAGPGAVRDAIEANARAEAQAAAAARKLAASQAAQAAQLAQAAQAAQLAQTAQVAQEVQLAQSTEPATPPATTPPATQPMEASPTVPPDSTPVATSTLPATAPSATAAASSLPPPATAPSATAAASSSVAATSASPATAARYPALSRAASPRQPPPKPESVFWKLKLPKETRDYVPRILALSRIVANPEAYGVRLPLLGNRPYLFRVDIAPEVKIADALALAGIPNEDFFRFNPGFKPGVEPPPRAYNLLLPLEQAQNLATQVPGVRLVAAKKYTVRKGETLAMIAKRHGVPSLQLAQWNNLEVGTVLKPGQQLIVYPSS